MEMNEKLARYILSLQNFKDAEVGAEDADLEVRQQIEEAFPIIKQERLDGEFFDWLLNRAEKDKQIVELHRVINRQIKEVEKMHGKKWETAAEGIRAKIQELHTLRMSLVAGYNKEVLRKEWEAERELVCSKCGEQVEDAAFLHKLSVERLCESCYQFRQGQEA